MMENMNILLCTIFLQGLGDLSDDTEDFSVDTKHVGLDLPFKMDPFDMFEGDFPIEDNEAKMEINNEDDILILTLRILHQMDF